MSLLAAATTGPPLTRVSEPYGFLSVGCGGWRVRATCSNDEENNQAASGCAEIDGFPFIVEAEIGPVSLMGLDRAELDRRAVEKLDSITSAAVARELWTGNLIDAVGDAAAFDHLSFQNATILDGSGTTARDPKRALAVLEDYLANLLDGPQGAIHATRGGAVVLPEKLRTGNTILTSVGTLVIPDAGYPGTAPDGTAAASGKTWLYASSVPVVSLGAASPEGVEVRSDNSLTVKVWRPAWVAFECGPAAVQMNLA